MSCERHDDICIDCGALIHDAKACLGVTHLNRSRCISCLYWEAWNKNRLIQPRDKWKQPFPRPTKDGQPNPKVMQQLQEEESRIADMIQKGTPL